jgi:hypothetical protein
LVGFGCEAVMEPLSITAAVAAAVGIVSPTLHCVHRLAQDIQEIRDAPDTVESLQDDLLTLEEALKSLQAISHRQWESLGTSVAVQSEQAMILCKKSSEKFTTSLGRWFRHSDGAIGKLSWRDQAIVGLFKQSQIGPGQGVKRLQLCTGPR